MAQKKTPSSQKFSERFPEISAQWDDKKNKGVSINDIKPCSGIERYWICSRGHSFKQSPATRTQSGKKDLPYCPVCIQNGLQTRRWAVSEKNNLEAVYPDVAKLWHPELNGDLLPSQISPRSQHVAWWKCSKGHTWQLHVGAVTNLYVKKPKDSLCPSCRSLQYTRPEIAAEWHPLKNGNITPEDVYKSDRKLYWWLCPEGHAYQVSISARTFQSSSCPQCRKESKLTDRAKDDIKIKVVNK